MGFLTEIAVFFLGLISLYVGLHDFLGLNIIPYEIFDIYVSSAFVSFSFIAISSLTYWLYRIKHKPLKKKFVGILKVSITIVAMGIYITSLPQEATSTFKLVVGKLFIVGGIALGLWVIQNTNKLNNSIESEQNKAKSRLYK